MSQREIGVNLWLVFKSDLLNIRYRPIHRRTDCLYSR